MENKWTEIQHFLENIIESGLYKVWIAPLSATISSAEIQIFAVNTFVAGRVRDRFMPSIVQACTQVLGKELSITIQVQQSKATSTTGSPSVPQKQAAASVATTYDKQNLQNMPQGLRTILASASQNMPMPCPLPASMQQNQQHGLPLDITSLSRRCNTKQWNYSFDDFVVGPCNELAYAATRSVCRKAPMSEVLFLNSGPGLGKTHLMQAAGQGLCHASNYSAPRVEYLTAEEFVSQLFMAIKSNDTERFKARYREADVLLLEDVHFLQGKEKIQAEVLATLKALQEKGSRVVLSSSFSPKELQGVDEQLVSRFCSGLLAGIERPTLETRREIVIRKAAVHQVILPEDVTNLLATHIQSDVRLIESCIRNLALKAQLLQNPVNRQMALDLLQNYADLSPSFSLSAIIESVCKGFALSPTQLQSRSRKKEYVVARNTAFFLARKHTDLSLHDIGERFNRQHSTVLKGISSLESEVTRETPLGRQIANTIAIIERQNTPRQ